jgi:hypothetical protein
MKLTNILEENSMLFEQHMLRSENLLHESCSGLNAVQRSIVEGIYNDLKPLIEASLSADQIQQLFKGVEQNVSATGNNRTLLGKGKDVAAKGVEVTKQANEMINKIGRWLQNTTPVQAFDQKFEKLKNDINTKFPDSKILDGISKLGIYAKENPGKTAAIVGVLTALASLAGGPVGGAIAGQVLRGAVELLKGEKLSTAIGKGVKTAALGYLSGKAFEMLGDWVAGFREQSIPFGTDEAGLEQISWQAQRTMAAPGVEWKETTQGFQALVRPEEAEAIRAAVREIQNGDAQSFDTLMALAKEVNSKDYKAGLDEIVKGAWQATKDNDSMLQWIEGLKTAASASSQGAVTAASMSGDKKATAKESVSRKNRPLSEGQVYLIFDRVCTRNNQLLSEGVIWEADNPAAPKMSTWDKIKSKAGEIGKNLTTKVTASKLMSAWKQAGQPTDSEELAGFLQKQGVNSEVVTKTYADMKLTAPTAAATPAAEKPAAPVQAGTTAANPTASTAPDAPAGATAAPNAPADAAQSDTANQGSMYSQVKTDISKLDKKSKQRLASYLQKQLGTM